AFVQARDRLKLLQPFKLAVIRTIRIKGAAMHNFDRAIKAHDIAGQPYFAIAAVADAPEYLVIGDNRRLAVHPLPRSGGEPKSGSEIVGFCHRTVCRCCWKLACWSLRTPLHRVSTHY